MGEQRSSDDSASTGFKSAFEQLLTAVSAIFRKVGVLVEKLNEQSHRRTAVDDDLACCVERCIEGLVSGQHICRAMKLYLQHIMYYNMQYYVLQHAILCTNNLHH